MRRMAEGDGGTVSAVGSTYRGCYANYHGQDARILRVHSMYPGLFHLQLATGQVWASVGHDRDFNPTQVKYKVALQLRREAAL